MPPLARHHSVPLLLTAIQQSRLFPVAARPGSLRFEKRFDIPKYSIESRDQIVVGRPHRRRDEFDQPSYRGLTM